MNKAKHILLTLVLLFALLPKAEAASPVFTDVPENHPNYAAIMYLLEKGVIAPQKRFGLNDHVTRDHGCEGDWTLRQENDNEIHRRTREPLFIRLHPVRCECENHQWLSERHI